MNETRILFRNFDRLYYECLSGVLDDKYRAGLYESVFKVNQKPKMPKNEQLIIVSNSLTIDLAFLNNEAVYRASHIVVVNQVQPMLVLNFFSAGGKGIVATKEGLADFLKCVNEVAEGRSFISSLISKEMYKLIKTPELISAPLLNSSSKLTNREIEIINLISDGDRTKEISTILGISYKTVEAHRHNIFKKLGIKSIAELVHFKKTYLP